MAKKTEEEIQKDLIIMRRENDVKFHEMRMISLEYVRNTMLISHEKEMERQRIKTAEIRKAFERRQASQYPRGQH